MDIIIAEDVDFRPFNFETDFGFVLKTYTQELHKVIPWNFIPNYLFFQKQTQLLQFLLQNGAQILIAFVKDFPNDLLGYVIYDDRIPNTLILHWIHIKYIVWRQGIAKELLNQLHYQQKSLICSHLNNKFGKFRSKLGISYNPYLLPNNL